MEVLGEVVVELRHAPDPRVLLDVALVRLTKAEADSSSEALLVRIEKLERAVAASAASGSGAAQGGATGPPAGGGPVPSGGRARVGSAMAGVDTPMARGDAPTAARPEDAPTAARPEVAAPPSRPRPAAAPAAPPSTTLTGGGVTRDELTLAWADQVIPQLTRQARAVLAAGRWVDAPDGVALALPNQPHRLRSEPHRAELETVLASQFGRPVPVTLVLEQDVPTPARPDGRAGPDRGEPESGRGPDPGPDGGRRRQSAPAPPPDPEEAIDPSELVDAGPEHDLAPIERLTQAFPGAELLEEG